MSDQPQIEPEEAAPQDRQPVFNLPTVIVAVIAICFAVHAARIYLIGDGLERWLMLTFAFFPIRYLPEFFTLDLATILSPVSYSLLHGGWLHLIINMVWLAAFGSPVAWRLGAFRTVVLWVLTAVGAVLLHGALYWGDPVPLIGASGAVSGFMGAAARFGFRTDRRVPRRGFRGRRLTVAQTLAVPSILGFLGVWMAVNYVAGAGFLGIGGDASIAWEAHIGGLLAGFFLIDLVDRDPKSP